MGRVLRRGVPARQGRGGMMPEHTPGPWKADIDGPFTLGGDTIGVEAVTPDGKMVRREICTLLIDTEEDDDTPEAMEDKANALLVAASPELLASCQEMREFIRTSKARP